MVLYVQPFESSDILLSYKGGAQHKHQPFRGFITDVAVRVTPCTLPQVSRAVTAKDTRYS